MNNKHPPKQEIRETISQTYSGPLVAATLSALLGLLTLVISHHISRLTKGLDQMVHSFGYWMPGSTGTGPDGSIGSYSGKETLALFVWGIVWVILHVMWRKLDFPLTTFTTFLIWALAFLMLGLFHPLIDPVVLFIAGFFGYAAP